MQFEGTFTIGRKENIRYNTYASQSRIIGMSAFVFAIIAVLLGITTYGSTGSVGAALSRALPSALWLSVLFFALNNAIIILRVLKNYRLRRIADFTQQITIDKAGVHVVSTRGNGLLKWKNVEKVQESSTTFYLFLSKEQAYVLPKYQLEKPKEDAETIRTLLRNNLDQSLLKLRK